MTPDQLHAKLPRVATWPPRLYDLTDDDERDEAVTWLMSFYVRDGKAVVVGSNDWAPPVKGTHESDLMRNGVIPWEHEGPSLDGHIHGRGGWDEYDDAKHWSETPDHPPAPGVTYYGRDDQR